MTSTGSSSSTPPDAPAAGRAELVIGLTTYNSAGLLDDAADGLRWAVNGGFGALTSRVVLLDGGSTDGTPERVQALVGADHVVALEYPVSSSDLLAQPHHGVPGRLRAVERILREAQDADARACVLVDPAACGAGIEWIRFLAEPVLTGHVDFVAGVQARHAYAGALVKGILAPVFRAVYGKQLRQPMADTYAVSGRLLRHYLAEAHWQANGTTPPVDVRLPAIAACDGFTLAEAALGVRMREGRDGPDLTAALSQSAGALFSELERRPDTWQRVRRSAPVATYGAQPADEPPAPAIQAERLADRFRLGWRELRDVWALVLPPVASVELKKLADAPLPRFRFDDGLWARLIYDYAIAHRLRALARDHLLPSLVPLYLGWFASFVLATETAGSAQAERRLERLGEVFEQEKPYLISRWRWPERTGQGHRV
jgi:glucosylglycerate synthase